ncbi:MAG: hypothetical protein IKJ67_09910 [Bacteroidales bacterium]|nr:hypothetical protein [Bacteroidales bacterium]
MQKIEIIEGVGDSQTKADAYKSVFGVCCEKSNEQIIYRQFLKIALQVIYGILLKRFLLSFD